MRVFVCVRVSRYVSQREFGTQVDLYTFVSVCVCAVWRKHFHLHTQRKLTSPMVYATPPTMPQHNIVQTQ